MSPFLQFAREARRLPFPSVARTVGLCALVGIVAGVGAIAFQYCCHAATRLMVDGLAGYRAVGPAGEERIFDPSLALLRPWLLPVVGALGGLLTGLLVSSFAPEAAGHGTDDAIDAFHRRRGIIRGRVPLVKTIASAITLGSGGSGGREGPIAQIGAGFGSFLATRLGLEDRERRILLVAGVGAGVGSIFRAPLAGALFAGEVLYSDPDFEPDAIIPAAIASIIAYCVFSLRFGFGALFETPEFHFHSALELVPYTGLALVVALGAGLFVRLFYGLHDAFGRLRMPKPLKAAIGGALTGALGWAVFAWTGQRGTLDVLAFGYGTLQDAMTGSVPLRILLLVAFGKMLTTGFSIGSGGSGGVFGPSMVIGGALGGAVGLLAQALLPGVVVQPGAYVPLGMAGFFAAAANTPISTLVMVSEMTGNYALILPSLWVCVLAYLVGRPWSLYRNQVANRLASPAFRGAAMGSVLRAIRVGEFVRDRPLHVIPEQAAFSEVLHTCMTSSQHCFPVVDPNGRMSGIVRLGELRSLLDEDGADARLIAADLAHPPRGRIRLSDDLETALQLLMRLELEDLPVVADEDEHRALGILSRRDISVAYARGAQFGRSATTPPRASSGA
ncbi:MAG: chloride channel protein [Candidatus Eisenbacteria bacterium]